MRAGSAGGLLHFEFANDGIDELALELNATALAFEKALGAALRKMAEWLKYQSVRGLSHELGVQQKIVRQRLKTFRLMRGGEEGQYKIFYGLDPIGYMRLGTPRKTAKGVRVGRFFINEGFVGRDKGGRQRVFKREGKARLPIEVQALDIKDKADGWIADKLFEAGDFDAKFLSFLEHELRWRTRTNP